MIFLALIFFAGEQKPNKRGSIMSLFLLERRSVEYNFRLALSMYLVTVYISAFVILSLGSSLTFWHSSTVIKIFGKCCGGDPYKCSLKGMTFLQTNHQFRKLFIDNNRSQYSGRGPEVEERVLTSERPNWAGHELWASWTGQKSGSAQTGLLAWAHEPYT